VGGKGGRKCRKEGKGGGGEKDGEEIRRGENDGRKKLKGKRNGGGGEGQEEATLGLLSKLVASDYTFCPVFCKHSLISNSDD